MEFENLILKVYRETGKLPVRGDTGLYYPEDLDPCGGRDCAESEIGGCDKK